LSSPALPAHSAPPRPPATHEEIDSRGFGEAMRKGLHLIRDGVPFRDAAREVGLASHQDLHRAAKRLGLLEVHTTRLVEGYKRIADLSNQELERRLAESPDEISTKDLAVVSGIAADKISQYENWRTRSHDPRASAGAFMDRLAALEATLTIKVEQSAPPTIDVTPRKAGVRA